MLQGPYRNGRRLAAHPRRTRPLLRERRNHPTTQHRNPANLLDHLSTSPSPRSCRAARPPSTPPHSSAPPAPNYTWRSAPQQQRLRTRTRHHRALAADANHAFTPSAWPTLDALKRATSTPSPDEHHRFGRPHPPPGIFPAPTPSPRSTAAPARIRIHGDYHLGQARRARGTYIILDFERRTPAPFAEHRAKQSPLRDAPGAALVQLRGMPPRKPLHPAHPAPPKTLEPWAATSERSLHQFSPPGITIGANPSAPGHRSGRLLNAYL